MLSNLTRLILLGGAGALAIRGLRPLRSLRRLVGRPARAAAADLGTCPQALLVPPVKECGLGFEEIATIPKPGSQGLSLVKFSPDDRHVTYLGSESAASLTRQLFAYDRQTGQTSRVIATSGGDEASFSREEQLRRERARIMSTGVTTYAWAADANRLLVPLDGALFVQDGVGAGADATLRRLFDPADPRWQGVGTGPLLDAKLSDDGKTVAFVWEDEVCLCEVPPAADGATPRRLTHGARNTGKTNGVADYCAQEEMDRYAGFWVSPSGSQVAFEEVDESHIPQYTIMHQGGEDPSVSEQHRYPFSGEPNPRVRLGVVRTDGATAAGPAGGAAPVVWFDLSGPFGEDFYLARVQWAPDGAGAADGADGAGAAEVLWAQVESRDQRSLALLRLDPATGAVSTIMTERNEVWINLHDALRPLDGGRSFLWSSEGGDGGWKRLAVHAASDGRRLRALTSGEFGAEEIVRLDEARGLLFFMGNPAAERHLEKHLYSVPLDGSAPPSRLTPDAGTHEGLAVSHDGTCFVDQHSSVHEPAAASIRELGGVPRAPRSFVVATPSRVVPLYAARDADERVNALAAVLAPPTSASFPSTDGKVTLHAQLYVPDPAVFGPGPHPAVVSCYGGPHVQFVANRWLATADLRAQFLRSQGYLVLKTDNRGSARRGLPFEAAISRAMGTLEVADQVAGVEYAVRAGLAARGKVGIFGWSYGGYLSAMCLAKAPETFRCAVAGAPVTSWDGYDTHYTERYMGTPAEEPAAYEAGSVMAHVDGIQGALLLVHGQIDENVHFRHTARLIQALVEAQKGYELLAFPKERHSPRSLKDRTFMEQQLFGFLRRWLGPANDAADA